MFDILGLPLHPLVVHAVVVLLPLSCLGVIACVLIARWRRNFAGLSIIGLAVGTVSAFVAAASGNALAAQVGLPAAHQAIGQVLPWVAASTLVLAGVWYFVQRGRQQQAALSRGLGALAAAAAAGSIVVTVLVGHSGATAVWGGTSAVPVTSATPSVSATASANPSASASASASASKTYTLDQVKQHNVATDCWAAIDGGVYNLTDWVNRHPGGAERIISICGTDATQAFDSQHSGDQRPEAQLTQFYLGDLA